MNNTWTTSSDQALAYLVQCGIERIYLNDHELSLMRKTLDPSHYSLLDAYEAARFAIMHIPGDYHWPVDEKTKAIVDNLIDHVRGGHPFSPNCHKHYLATVPQQYHPLINRYAQINLHNCETYAIMETQIHHATCVNALQTELQDTALNWKALEKFKINF